MSNGHRQPWALELDNISAGHEGRPVVQNFSARLSPGHQVAVVGPNGAGKSTLLQVLAGDLPPLGGQLRWQPRPRGGVAWLAQQNPIERDFPISLEGFVGTGLWPRQGLFRRFTPQDRQRLDGVLTQLGLIHLARRPISKLSGGQFQRMRFARMLLQDACLLLLDEP
ncbi:MAG: ATP-binding cassette domain-containing protein, partial [Halomonadaceae bacterium]